MKRTAIIKLRIGTVRNELLGLVCGGGGGRGSYASLTGSQPSPSTSIVVKSYICLFRVKVFMYTPEGVSSAANFVTTYEESQFNRDFHFLSVTFSLFLKAVLLTLF